ncbi:hypothetical protein C8R43DRAFT_941468 [Mycena crocata]|nr:hypothetical protein C8R43DRAFT_941468 [Mycena crocata]
MSATIELVRCWRSLGTRSNTYHWKDTSTNDSGGLGRWEAAWDGEIGGKYGYELGIRTPTGRASAFQGEKLLWLLGLENEWRTTDRTAFYDKITKLFFARYGYDLPIEENVPGDISNWTPVNRKLGLTPEQLVVENDFQEEKRVALRQKLANWFRNEFKGRRLHSGALSAIMKRMQAMSGPGKRPRRKTPLAWYSGKYYATRMKADFDAVWEGAKEALPSSARISMCQDFVKARLAAETEEFTQKLEEEAAEAHAAEMKKYKQAHVVPEKTAEQYHEALQSFDEVGIPLVDALAERMGMHMILFAIGPVGDQRGEVRLRSIFSDTASGRTNKIWGEFDRTAFTEAEASLTRYGRAFFSPEECRARAWPPLEVAPAEPAFDDMIRMAPEGSDASPQTDAEVQPVAAAPTPATAVAAAPANITAPQSPVEHEPSVSTTSPGRDDSTLDDPELKARWTQTQLDVVEMMQSKVWGARWKALLAAVITFEESVLWAQGKLPRSSCRPSEIAAWMKDRRKAGDYKDAKNWKADFGERFMAWWRDIGPASRQGERPSSLPADQPWPRRGAHEDAEDFVWSEWEGIRVGGDNGMLLVVQAFTWWGQEIFNAGAADGLGGGEAALGENEQWQDMLEDLLFSYKEMTDVLDAETRAELDEERRMLVGTGEGDGRRAEIAREQGDHGEVLPGVHDPDKGESEGARRFFALRERRNKAEEAAAQSKARMEAVVAALRVEDPAGAKKKSKAPRKRKRTPEAGDGQEGEPEPPTRKTRSGGAASRPQPKPSWRGAGNIVGTTTAVLGTEAQPGEESVAREGGGSGPETQDVVMEDVRAEQPHSAESMQQDSEPLPFGRSGLLVHGADGRLHRAATTGGTSTASVTEGGQSPVESSKTRSGKMQREMALDAEAAADDDDEDDLEKRKEDEEAEEMEDGDGA